MSGYCLTCGHEIDAPKRKLDWRVRRELQLLHDEIARQNKEGFRFGDHDSHCACWRCIGELQAYVMETREREQ